MSGRPHWLGTIGAPLAAACAVALAAAGAAPPGPEARLPSDLVFDREVGEEQAVVFRHWTHVEFTAWNCLACHPEPFKLLRPERSALHEALDAGRSCGSCHDARQAFGTADEAACETCHVGRPDPATHVGARPGELRLAGGDSPGPVTFSHVAHRDTGQGCRGCHPDAFAARAGATTGEFGHFHERCGACHDGETACAVDDACESCHALPGGGP